MSNETIAALIKYVITPIITDLQNESFQGLNVHIVVIGADCNKFDLPCDRTSIPEAAEVASAEVRMLVRDTYTEGIKAFEIESIIKGLAPGTGFSGFSARGKIDLRGEIPDVHLAGRTNRYNVWNWGRKFRLKGET